MKFRPFFKMLFKITAENPTKRTQMPRMNIMAATCIMFVVFILIPGCDRTEKDWETASQENTIEAYEKFILHHPKGEIPDKAREVLQSMYEDRDWNAILDQGTSAGNNDIELEALRDFIETYVDSARLAEARSMIDKIEWNMAWRTGDPEIISVFIDTHQDSTYAESRDFLLDACNWNIELMGSGPADNSGNGELTGLVVKLSRLPGSGDGNINFTPFEYGAEDDGETTSAIYADGQTGGLRATCPTSVGEKVTGFMSGYLLQGSIGIGDTIINLETEIPGVNQYGRVFTMDYGNGMKVMQTMSNLGENNMPDSDTVFSDWYFVDYSGVNKERMPRYFAVGEINNSGNWSCDFVVPEGDELTIALVFHDAKLEIDGYNILGRYVSPPSD